MTRYQKLSLFLGVLVILQSVLYIVGMQDKSNLWWAYLDPRIGLTGLLEMMGIRGGKPMVIHWIAAIWLGIVAVRLFLKPWWLRLYLYSEPILALPTLLFFIFVFFSNASPVEGFSWD
jgi:hypothetical protein